jgi:5'-nucleotidase
MLLKYIIKHIFLTLALSSILLSAQPTYADIKQAPNKLAPIKIRILGINDFHGQVSTGRFINNEPVGGAAVLAAYLKQEQSGMEDSTLITIMGDQVGASTPASGLLHDEPSILFTNSLGNKHCTSEERMNPKCNIVATVGNHEFDNGQKAMFDLIYGTETPPTDSWIPLDHYPGSNYPYISANIVDAETNKPIFPPYTIKLVNNIPVAFIGAVLKNAADTMFPANGNGIKFLDEAETINKYIPEIKAKGVNIIIVLIHEGGNQTPYEGTTQTNTQVNGSINKIVYQLDDVDVVMCGHTHQFLNAYLTNHNDHNILVTQANSYSASFAEVNLQIDAQTHSLTHKSAQIITTYANRWPGTKPDEKTQELVQLAENKVEPIINAYVGTTQNTLLRKQNEEGESNLGNLIADAFRITMENDIGLTNPHGIRNDIQNGSITWGAIYSVMPFSNHIVSLTLTGQEIYELLEQQWVGAYANMLQVSGLTYTYDLQQPLGHRITGISHQDQPLIIDKTYTIATTDFMAAGNGVFSVMKKGKVIKIGGSDRDAVIHYIKQLPQPFTVVIDGRIKKGRHHR